MDVAATDVYTLSDAFDAAEMKELQINFPHKHLTKRYFILNDMDLFCYRKR
jgi:hypothetical protein